MSAQQLDLNYRSSDPPTSRAAGEAVDLNARCREVLEAARQFTLIVDSTFTDGELAAFIGEDRNIVARRRLDLLERRLVEPVYADERGVQAQRAGRRGRMELVWRVTP
jgi:hypothetical protein